MEPGRGSALTCINSRTSLRLQPERAKLKFMQANRLLGNAAV
jgi:hypothetical protein